MPSFCGPASGEEFKHTPALPLVEAINRYTISTPVAYEISSNLLSN